MQPNLTDAPLKCACFRERANWAASAWAAVRTAAEKLQSADLAATAGAAEAGEDEAMSTDEMERWTEGGKHIGWLWRREGGGGSDCVSEVFYCWAPGKQF